MSDDHPPSPTAPAPTESASAVLESHLLSLTAAIGGFEDTLTEDGSLVSNYVLGDECLECLRDVKRFLRYDEANDEKTVALLLGKWQLVQNHLVPIILGHSANQSIFFAAIELLVPLTWPLQAEHLKTELLPQQRSYKQVVVESYALDTVFQQLLMLLSVPARQRNERTNAIVRLVLYLFRNLLAIPDPAPGANVSAVTFQQSQMQETLVHRLHSLDALEFFVAASSNVAEREYSSWNMILVEIFFLLFCTTTPRSLCRLVSENQADLLESLLEKENASRIAQKPRHSRFAANFTVVQGGNTRLFVRGIEATVDAVNATKQKNRPRSRFGKGDASTTSTIDSTLTNTPVAVTNSEYAQLLRNLASSFLTTAFDPLVSSAKRDMDAERSHVRDEDPIQLMYLIQFFFEFQRLNQDTHNVNLLSSIANVHGMLFLIKNVRTAVDEQQPSRLHMALECLREFLLTAQLMRSSKDDEIRDLAINILDNLYYERNHLDMFIHLFRTFKQQSWRHLVALISVVHVMLKAMEMHIAALGKESLTVRQAKRKSGRSTRKDGDAEELIAHDVEDPDPDAESKERQFVEKDLSFANVEALFCNDAVVDKYMLMLSRLADLTPDQVYAVTKMLYRVAVHREQYALFFQLHYLNMMHVVLHNKDVNRLVNQSKRKRKSTSSVGPSSSSRQSAAYGVKTESKLPSSPATGSEHTAASVVPKLVALLRLILNKFFTCFEAYPLMGIDILFSHTKSDLDRLVTGRLTSSTSSTRSGRTQEDSGPPTWDSDVELEVRPGFSRKMEVQIAVSALLLRNESKPVLDRLLATLTKLAQLRKRAKADGNSDDGIDGDDDPGTEQPWSDVMLSIPPSDITIKEMRLLVKSLGMQVIKLDGMPDAETGSVLESVVAPGSILGEDLDEMIAWIVEARDDPIKHKNKPAYKLLKAKRPPKPRRKKERDLGSDEEEEQGPKKKRMSKKAANAKSAAFVYDSDEMLEGEDDSAFYQREDDRREQTKRLHEAMMKEKTPTTPAAKGTGTAEKRAARAGTTTSSAADQDHARGILLSGLGEEEEEEPTSDTDADDESDGAAQAQPSKRRLKRPQRPRHRALTLDDDGSGDEQALSGDGDDGTDLAGVALASAEVADDGSDDSFAAKLAVLRAATQSITSSVPRSRLFAVISDDEDDSDTGLPGPGDSDRTPKRARME